MEPEPEPQEYGAFIEQATATMAMADPEWTKEHNVLFLSSSRVSLQNSFPQQASVPV